MYVCEGVEEDVYVLLYIYACGYAFLIVLYAKLGDERCQREGIFKAHLLICRLIVGV